MWGVRELLWEGPLSQFVSIYKMKGATGVACRPRMRLRPLREGA